MSYDFPASPTEDQEYVPPVGGQTYVYKAPRWLVKGIPPSSAGGGGGGIAEAPVDGQQYARQNAAWSSILIPAGDWDSITGKPITFPPTVPIAWTDVNGKPVSYPPTLPIAQSGITNLVSDQAAQDTATAAKVAKAGDTMTGTLNIVMAAGSAVINLCKSASGQLAGIYGRTGASSLRWLLQLGDAGTESGGNVGSGFAVSRYSDSGSPIDTPLYIFRDTGLVKASNGVEMNGDSQLWKSWPTFTINKNASGEANGLGGKTNFSQRWLMYLGDNTAESGSNAGSDFALFNFNDSGASLGTALAIKRSTGLMTVKADPTAALGVATKQYVDAKPGGATISDTAPATPLAGQLWFESDTGLLFVYYNDGNSSQWVPATVGAAGPPGPQGVPGDPVGGTMTSDLSIVKSYPALNLHGTPDGAGIWATAGGLDKWTWGVNFSSSIGNLTIDRFDAAGAFIDSPIVISRATGQAEVTGNPTTALGIATKQYVDAKVPYLQNSVVFDPANLTTGSVDAIQTLTVTGAALGDFCSASFSVDQVGVTLLAWVSAANTVKFQFQNKTAGTQNLASGTVRVRVWKQ